MGKNAKLIRRFDILIVVILISTFLIILTYCLVGCFKTAIDIMHAKKWFECFVYFILLFIYIVCLYFFKILIVDFTKDIEEVCAKVSGREDRLKRKAKEIEYEISSLIVFVEKKISYIVEKEKESDHIVKKKSNHKNKNEQGIDFSNDQISQPLINDILEIKEKTVKLHKILEESSSYTEQQKKNLNNFISKCVKLLTDFQLKSFEKLKTDYKPGTNDKPLTLAFQTFLNENTNNDSETGNGNGNGNGKS